MTRRRRILIVLGAALAVVAVAGYVLARRTPSWWNPPHATDQRAARTAETFEQRLAEEVSRVRADDAPWAVRIGEEQLNAWFALRLPRWLEHAGAPADALVQAHLRDGAIEFAVRPTPGAPIGVVAVRPRLGDGALAATIDHVGIGAIGLPGRSADVVAAVIDSLAALPDDDEMSRAALSILRGDPVSARFTLGDGRRVELTDLELEPGAIVAQLRTIPASRFPAKSVPPKAPPTKRSRATPVP
ncbi:MAG: hypothetical protein U0575_15880 [Phycisphaerales bacterium]